MQKIAAIAVSLILFILAKSPADATCLSEVADFALRICGEIATSGSAIKLDAKGNVEANVSNIIKRVVGGASAQLNGSVLYDTYVGVARDQLAGAQFNALECRQKMVTVAVAQVCSKPSPRSDTAPKKPPKLTYSYFASAASLIGKDISEFQAVPKTIKNSDYVGIVSGYPETLLEGGRAKTLNLDVRFDFRGPVLKSLRILAEDGGDDCLKTDSFRLMFGVNESIWGHYRKADDRSGYPKDDEVKGMMYAYCGKDHTYMTFWIFTYNNPERKYKSAQFLCSYFNDYQKEYEDMFYRC